MVIKVGPALDFRSATAFRTTCEDHIRCGRKFFVLDLSRTTILDSTGLGAIFHIYRQLRSRGGRILFAAPSQSAGAVIELTRSHNVFGTYPSVDAALRDLASMI